MEKFQLDKPDNLVELFESSVTRFPERPFLGTKNRAGAYEWVTYREVGQRKDGNALRVLQSIMPLLLYCQYPLSRKNSSRSAPLNFTELSAFCSIKCKFC